MHIVQKTAWHPPRSFFVAHLAWNQIRIRKLSLGTKITQEKAEHVRICLGKKQFYSTLQNTKMTTLLASDPSQSSRIDGLNPALFLKGHTDQILTSGQEIRSLRSGPVTSYKWKNITYDPHAYQHLQMGTKWFLKSFNSPSLSVWLAPL